MPELIICTNSPKTDISRLVLGYTGNNNVKLTLTSNHTDLSFKLDDGSAPYKQFPVILEYILRCNQSGSLLVPSNDVLKGSMDSFVNLASKYDYSISEVDVLKMLNDHLLNETFFVGPSITLADLVMFVSLYQWMSSSKLKDLAEFVNLVRWYDHIQHLPGIVNSLEGYKVLTVVEDKPLVQAKPKVEKEKKPKKEKKENVEVRPYDDVTRLNVVIGLVISIRKHPDADKLYCLRIDIGTEIRNICSGLVEFLGPEEILNKKVCVLANLSKKILRGEESNGMVLCVSNNDHTKVELLVPPDQSNPGDKVHWDGYNGEPDDVLSSKKGKETFTLVQKDFKCIDRIGYYRDSKFMTLNGPCYCSTITDGIIS